MHLDIALFADLLIALNNFPRNIFEVSFNVHGISMQRRLLSAFDFTHLLDFKYAIEQLISGSVGASRVWSSAVLPSEDDVNARQVHPSEGHGRNAIVVQRVIVFIFYYENYRHPFSLQTVCVANAGRWVSSTRLGRIPL